MSATPCPILTKSAYIARAANRLRQNKRPADPTTIDFDLREDALRENFMRADITTTRSRHIIFATDPLTRKLICLLYVKTCVQIVQMSGICFSKTDSNVGRFNSGLCGADRLWGGSTAEEAVETFLQKLHKVIEEKNLIPEQIYNGETGRLWKCLPQKILVCSHEKSVPGFKSKWL